MRRLALLLGFALALSVGAGSGGADIGSVSTVGIDVALNLDQNQPAPIGDFTGKVGWALFSQGKGVGFSHFESDMRFEQGTARNPVTAADAFGQWGFTWVDFFQTVGSTVYHHDFHVDSFFPFWTAALSTKSLHLGGFPNVAVFDVKNMPVIDEVSIVNGDGSETPVATYSAQITAHIVWQHAAGAPVSISGLTEPTLVPEDVVPGTPSVPQQPFSGSMGLDRATADFSAVAFAGDGSVVQKFHVEGVQSEFAELGTESLGVFAN